MKAKLRKLALWLALAVAVSLVALLVFVTAFLGRAIKYGVETFGPRYAKAPISVGSVSISLFSGRGEVKDFVVGNPEGFSASPAVKVGRIKIDVDVSSLLSETLVVEEINVESPQVNYELSLDGGNIDRLLENLKSGAARPATAPQSGAASQPGAPTPGRKVLVKDFKVSGGRVKLAAPMLSGGALDVPLPAVELKDVGSGSDAAAVAWQLSAAFGDSILGAVKRDGLLGAAGSLLNGTKQGSSSDLLNGVKGLLGGGGGK